MLQRLFPAQLDNTYRGSRIAIWLLVPIVLAKLAIGGNVMIQTRMVATNADGIPLDSYNAAGAQAVLAFFALWGLGQAILALLGVLALIRYRSMIPLIYLVLLIEQLGRKALFLAKPIAHAGTQGSALINLVMVGLLLAGLALSLLRLTPPAAARPPGQPPRS